MAQIQKRLPVFALLFSLVAGYVSAAPTDDKTAPFIAGSAPSVRPANAPVIHQFDRNADWQTKARQGIAQPQTGIEFLKDQGAWYTPFTHPGMPGFYDIRGLHAPTTGVKK